jgi:hypothetical protein
VTPSSAFRRVIIAGESYAGDPVELLRPFVRGVGSTTALNIAPNLIGRQRIDRHQDELQLRDQRTDAEVPCWATGMS